MRVDSPGAIIEIAPPRAWVVFGVLGATFVGLVLLAIFGRAEVVAEGRGVLNPDQPPLTLRARVAGTVLAVRRRPGEIGRAGDLIFEFDAKSDAEDHARCVSTLGTEQAELDMLDRRLAAWNGAAKGPLHGAAEDPALALVLLSQLRAQREQVRTQSARCDALASILARSRIAFPVDASVVDVVVSPGARVEQGDLLALLEPQSAKLVGYIELPEAHRSEVSRGEPVRLDFDALPFANVGAGTGHVVRELDALPSNVKLDSEPGAVFEIALDAMPKGTGVAHSGMTFGAGVLTGRVRLLSLLFGD